MLYYLGIGTNIGAKETNIENAVQRLAEIGTIRRRSSNFYSEPWGFVSENSFLNIVISIDTHLNPFELLEYTQKVERELGRSKKSINGVYSDRIIDIDILLYNGEDIHTETLQIPHPLIEARDFVRIPLEEIKE